MGEAGLKPGRLDAIEVRIVAVEKLAFKSVRFKQNVSRNPFPFHLHKFPQAIHSLHYALMDHRVSR
jgi:hypothetical protein